jgi:sulfur relay (sulfurtransferase) complex TusBCD TusD component (DsrE family)
VWPGNGLPAVAGRSLFLGLIGAPYESDLLTTTVRIAQEAVRQGHRVTVWTCGYATSLTTASAAMAKPRNVLAWDTQYPAPAALALRLLDWGGPRLNWLVCRYCAEERGTLEQLPEVRIRPPYEFMQRYLDADTGLVLGTK